ncbi:MAG: M23 family metallopeptidase [Polyangiales bacterium]|nr:M23 family metallopeptidase [Myxococcales bacterium]
MRRVFPLVASVVVLALGALAASPVASERHPWLARKRPGLRPNYADNARTLPGEWPAEPPSPKNIDAERLGMALRSICGAMPVERAKSYGAWMVASGAAFGEDPFLLAALVRRLGNCRPDSEDLGGIGLTLIRREMYADQIRKKELRFQVLDAGGWREQAIAVPRFPFAGPRLVRAEENLYFAAALLQMWRLQHASVDGEFDQVPHRHHVSHFVWGDRVRSQRDEDRIFTDRRRILEAYGARSTPTIKRLGLTWRAPLDGAPRTVTSGIGDSRDDGERDHRGVDLESLPGEIVRAPADGEVVFAGVDLPGRQNHVALHRGEYDRYPKRSLGHGGRFVCLRHRRAGADSIRTCYMHLEEVHVEPGMDVRAGDSLGTVGRTGMERSAAHLHFELHTEAGPLDAGKELAGVLIGDPSRPPTYPAPSP